MHPIHSDLVAGLVRAERLRAAAVHQGLESDRRGPADEGSRAAAASARRALDWFRGAAHLELRHHA